MLKILLTLVALVGLTYQSIACDTLFVRQTTVVVANPAPAVIVQPNVAFVRQTTVLAAPTCSSNAFIGSAFVGNGCSAGFVNSGFFAPSFGFGAASFGNNIFINNNRFGFGAAFGGRGGRVVVRVR